MLHCFYRFRGQKPVPTGFAGFCHATRRNTGDPPPVRRTSHSTTYHSPDSSYRRWASRPPSASAVGLCHTTWRAPLAGTHRAAGLTDRGQEAERLQRLNRLHFRALWSKKGSSYSLLDPVLFHQLVKRRPTDAQFDGGRGDFAGMLEEDSVNHFALCCVPCCFQIITDRDSAGAFQLQIRSGQSISFGHDDSALYPVFQLHDVAGPVIVLNGRNRIPAKLKLLPRIL